MRLHDIAVVGASGLVGRKILEVLQERDFPFGKVIAIASDISDGKEISVNKKNHKLHKFDKEITKNLEFAFFSAGARVSKEYAKFFAEEGALVIDNSSAFRFDDEIPLVVPEVNRQDIFKHKGIISNPNCSTIQLVAVLKPLDDLFGIKRIVVSTYQSVSGAGNKGISQLHKELHNENVPLAVFPHKIAYNAIPQIDVFMDSGYSKEEYKMMFETMKIMHRPDLNITATCVRIPTLVGHCESVNIELAKDFTIDGIRNTLSRAKGVAVMDDINNLIYPMPVNSNEKDEIFVGRIRRDDSVKYGLNLWIVADNVRKGAATNAVQIAEEYLKGK